MPAPQRDAAAVVVTEHKARIKGPMNQKTNQAESKKPYESPKLTTISLRPEEAVLGHCKVAGSGGPGGICGFTCMNAGS
jgi:hypothetical protein